MNYYHNFLRTLLALFLLAACNSNDKERGQALNDGRTGSLSGSEQGQETVDAAKIEGEAVDKKIALARDEKVEICESKEAEKKALTHGKELIKGLTPAQIDSKILGLLMPKKSGGPSKGVRDQAINSILLQKETVPKPEVAKKILLYAIKHKKHTYIALLLEKDGYKINDDILEEVLLEALKKDEKTVLLILDNVKDYIKPKTVVNVFERAAETKKVQILSWILENKNSAIKQKSVRTATQAIISSKSSYRNSAKPQSLRLIVEKRHENLEQIQVGEILDYAVASYQYTLTKAIFEKFAADLKIYDAKITQKKHYEAISRAVKQGKRWGYNALLRALFRSESISDIDKEIIKLVFAKAVQKEEVKVMQKMIKIARHKSLNDGTIERYLKETIGPFGRGDNIDAWPIKNQSGVLAILQSIPKDFFMSPKNPTGASEEILTGLRARLNGDHDEKANKIRRIIITRFNIKPDYTTILY